MRVTKKQLFIGTPLALAAVAAIAFLAVWAWGVGGKSGEDSQVKANVEYTIRGADGVVKAHGLFHNAVVDAMRVNASDSLRGVAAANYAIVQLCATGTSSGTTIGTLCATETANVGTNPDTGTVAGVAVVAGTSKSFTVTLTFTAVGAATISEIQLGRGTLAATLAAADIGAFRALAATLASGDALTVVWTVTIS